jgi:nucleoside-diphosphate-sugar epimerase
LINLLITGANGYIGQDIMRYAEKDKNYKIIGVVRRKIKTLQNKKRKTVIQNLEKELVINSSIDAIIHCAEKNPLSSLKNYKKNKIIAKNLIKFSLKNKVKKIIFLSSITVYGKIKKKIINENYKKNKPNLYGQQKIKSESILLKKYKDLSVISLRLPGILVLNTKLKKILIMSIINKANSNKKINIYNPEENFNNVLDTLELFNVIKKILDRKIKKNSIYNLSASKPIKFFNMVNFIIKKMKSKSNIKTIFNSKKSFIISNKKFSRDYNFTFSTTKKIITRFCKAYKKLMK